MRKFCKQGASILLALLCWSACDKNTDYPERYIGFDKVEESYVFDKNTDEKDISIKIIAAEKQNTDREVSLTAKWKPGTSPVFKLLDKKTVIPARKKSASVRIRVYPKLLKGKEEIRITCSPADKEAKQSQITLRLMLQQ